MQIMNEELAGIFIYTIVPVIFCGFIIVVCIIMIDRSRDEEETSMRPVLKQTDPPASVQMHVRKPDTVLVVDPQSNLCVGIKQPL